jgi:Flp pilus assembly pilin Flp
LRLGVPVRRVERQAFVNGQGGTAQPRDRSLGQGLVEYGLIIAIVAALAIASLLIFRPEISSVLSDLSNSV